MFKEENRIWLYMIGILIMFGILGLSTQNILIPFFTTGSAEVDVTPVFERAPPNFINLELDYRANIVTNYGTLVFDLFEGNAPGNVNNFTFLANEDFYVGTKFHRVFPNFLIQGGDRNTLDNDISNDGLGGPGYVIRDEINLDSLNLSDERRNELKKQGIRSNEDLLSANLVKYTIAMANSGPNTNGSQFFIVMADTADPRLQLMNGQYTVIGQVVDGFATLNNINSIPVDATNPNIPRPTQDIILQDIQVFTL